MPALRLARRVLARLALAAGCGLAAVATVVGLRRLRRCWLAVTVTGDDMAPTVRAGQRVLVRRTCSRNPAAPGRADLVVFRPPSALSFQLESSDLPLRVARVVAVAGERAPSVGVAEPGPCVPPGKLLVAGDGQDAGSAALIDADDVVGIVGR
jgi:signal peptidase I